MNGYSFHDEQLFEWGTQGGGVQTPFAALYIILSQVINYELHIFL